MVMAPLFGLTLSNVPAAHAGSGGGVMSTVQQIGNASGVAAIGAVYYGIPVAHSTSEGILACLALLATVLSVTAALLRGLARTAA